MGTAGPLAVSADLLRTSGKDGQIFVFNSDVTCDFPLHQMIEAHLHRGGEGTIAVTQVQDPSKYGVVVAKENQQIDRFVEKPTQFVSDNINAGLYLFNESVLERIPNRPCSIEREIFPQMASDGKIFQF